jgi:hypothetical protein
MNTKLLALAPVALALAAGAAEAQGFGLTFKKDLGHGAAIHFTLGDYCKPAPHRRSVHWVPGHYETVERDVWVPGTCEKVWIEPCYETRYDACGRPYRVLVKPGHWTTVETPGHFETRCVQVWVEGCWKPSHACG